MQILSLMMSMAQCQKKMGISLEYDLDLMCKEMIIL